MLKPLGDKIIARVLSESNTTKGGIILPDTAKEKPLEAEVVAVGPGKLLDNGKLTPMEVKKGDIIVYSKYAGNEIKIGDDDYIILREDEALAIIDKSKTEKKSKK